MNSPWSLAALASTLVMWVVMMVVMMLPAAMPMLRVAGAASRQAAAEGRKPSPPPAMAVGYFGSWIAFSVVATVIQAELQGRALLSPELALVNARIAALLLVAAGVYQFTPVKRACLSHCRTPFAMLLSGWREGVAGAIRMGIDQGAHCVACCWALMLVLFVVGVMSPLWIIVLGAVVALERASSGTRWPRLAVGGSLVAAGLLMAVGRL